MTELQEKAHSLPRLPGVYLMQDKHKQVIYVGKAKSLRNRVSQYFQDSAGHNLKTRIMVGQVAQFHVIVVGSEFEALVLESSLIKRHQPKYNILLKDSKGYPYIRLSVGEAYPKFSLVSQLGQEKASHARYFGPYGTRHNTQAIVDALKSALALPQCTRQFPRDLGKERPCLNHHMGKCLGHCRPVLGKKAHDIAIKQAVSLLEGKHKEVTQALEQEMEAAAEALRFELAAELRDRLRAISLLSTKQKVVASTLADTHVIGFARHEKKATFVVLHYLDGQLMDKELEGIPSPLEEPESALSALVREYYHVRITLPQEILLPFPLESQDALSRLLSEQAGHKVSLWVPQRGSKAEIVQLAQDNAQEELERVVTKEEREHKNLRLLGDLLGLEQPPHRIESYDISNTQGSHIVGAMVVYQEGRGQKSQYRKFKLRDMDGPDDYASMKQVLSRRFQRYCQGDASFSSFPDLLLIDGGLEHVKIACEVLGEYQLSCPAFGMVKDHRHRTRALISPLGQEIGIVQHPSIFALIGQIQEETHRVAISFHRQQQSKALQQSQLEEIPGVGEARRKALWQRFSSRKAMEQASLAQLEELLPKKVAQAVYDYFREKEQGKCE